MANTTKQVKKPRVAPVTGLANITAPITAVTVTTTTAPQPTKKPAITYVAGHNPLAPENAPVVVIGGQPWEGSLPATNPANRATVGNVSAKVPNKLTFGNGKSPRSVHGKVAWQAITVALVSGPQSAATLANACGAGGAAFVAYAVRNGWLAASK